MIWLDVTKTAGARHRSGLTRVTVRLKEELGEAARAHAWAEGTPGGAGGAYVTAEVFAPAERAGFEEFLATPGMRKTAIFHDAIPLKLPHITWPQAVARHPAYLSMLARFDQVYAVSAASREELLGFWRWQGKTAVPPVEVLPLGADFGEQGRPPVIQGAEPAGTAAAGNLNQLSSPGAARLATALRGGDARDDNTPAPPKSLRRDDASSSLVIPAGARGIPLLLCVGILEPRKNQGFLVEVAESLARGGVRFEVVMAGRVNPHFGDPILKRIRQAGGWCRYEGAVDDAALAALYARAAACVLPTIAEGCGLPLLEALWLGTPCVCSDLPALRENAAGGGCVTLPVNDRAAWSAALRRLLTDVSYRDSLAAAARARHSTLPTWAQTAGVVREKC